MNHDAINIPVLQIDYSPELQRIFIGEGLRYHWTGKKVEVTCAAIACVAELALRSSKSGKVTAIINNVTYEIQVKKRSRNDNYS